MGVAQLRPSRCRLALGGLMAAMLAACGGGGGDGATRTAASAASSPAVATAAQRTSPGILAAQWRRDGVQTVPGRYNVRLAAPSVSEQFADEEARVRIMASNSGEAAASAARTTLQARRQAYHQQLEGEQQALGARVRGLGGKVLTENRIAVNLVTVEATAEQAEAIAALPGVLDVQPVRLLPRPGLKTSAQNATVNPNTITSACYQDPLAGTGISKTDLLTYHDIAGAHINGRRGQGVLVGVVDDGVDYTHVAMGGPGTAAMLNRAMVYAFANDPSRLASAMFPYPGSKVIGGHDYIGNDQSPFPDF